MIFILIYEQVFIYTHNSLFAKKQKMFFPKNSIFDVDNIIIDQKSKISNNQILDTAFQRGFVKLSQKILLNKDQKKMNDVGLNQIKQLVSRYQIINKEDLKK